MSNKSNLKENKGLNLSVSKADYKDNEQTLTNAVGDEGSITISNKPTMATEGEIAEDVKIDMHGIIDAFGIDIFRKSPSQKAEIIKIINQTLNVLRQKGLSNVIFNESDEEFRDDDLFTQQDSDKVEYGVKNEDFDKLMEDLKKSGAPKININEKINPRIKKSDLINYIKNKK